MNISMTFLVSAGAVTEDDNRLGVIQGLSLDQAEAVADWLAMATEKPVKLQFMPLGAPVTEIQR